MRTSQTCEIRLQPAAARAEGATITGLIPYDVLSENSVGFRERILPSAFRLQWKARPKSGASGDKSREGNSLGNLGLEYWGLGEPRLEAVSKPRATAILAVPNCY